MVKQEKKEDWINIEEIVGSSKKLQIKLLADSKGISTVRIIGDKQTIYFQLAFPFTTTPTKPVEIPAFNLTFQLPRNRKSRLPYHMPSFDINLGIFKGHFEKAE